MTKSANVPDDSRGRGDLALAAMTLVLSKPLRDQLAAEAIDAYPRECCGLIEGLRRGTIVEAVRLHPARNLATRPDRFEIDPKEQFRLMRALRDTERDIVGCYHSHPDGDARPSPRDLEGASEELFAWVIVATDGRRITGVRSYVFRGSYFQKAALVCN